MKTVDVHVHLAAFPTPDNGCRLSRRMRTGPLARLIAFVQNLPLDDPEKANRRYLDCLEQELRASEEVERAVLLAMDGVYDAKGKLDEKRTNFLISNDYLFAVTAARPCFLPGASVNPMRADALDEIDRCADKGAVLIKTLANAQVFNPADSRFTPYFRRLAKRGLPFLSHVGFEFSLIGHDQSVGDVDRLIPALEEGVTVIAAHGCSSGLVLLEKHFRTMCALVRRYPNFYVDLSALTLPNRVGALMRIRRRPELFDRLLFGTDYPLPVFSYPALVGGGYLHARAAGNRFDRQARVLRSLGLPVDNILPSLQQYVL
ncbi:MAG: amidohydrolase family protein [Elusimicrobiota bacterium]